MSRKSDLSFKKRTELVDIILRKDDVEKELKEKNAELSSQVESLTNSQKESNKKIGKLSTEVNNLKETVEEKNKKLTERENLFFELETVNSRKTIVIICLIVIAIVGWII